MEGAKNPSANRQGGSNKVIASSLGIAPETMKSHVKNIFMKLS
jgi:DNA-binding NarL/FixJ family response regulator